MTNVHELAQRPRQSDFGPQADAKVVVEHLTYRFHSVVALKDANLTIGAKEFVCILGPSGCGKSTLFNAVSGLLRPDEGRILIDGQDVAGRSGRVGYMLQKDLLLPWRTVIGNITLGAALTRRVTKADRIQAKELAMRYGLGDFLNHYPHALSGGMRQRVAMMRTIASGRDVMLLDEPFGALDAQTRLDMQQWLLRVWAEMERTVLFVTHDIDEALFLADRVVVMTPRPGRIQTILTVPLARPRDRGVLTAPEFVELKREIMELLYSTTPKSPEVSA